MRHIGLIVFLFLFYRSAGYSQNPCNCNGYEKTISEIETFLEKKNYLEFDSKINLIDTKNLVCKQRVFSFLLDKYIGLNQMDKADSVLNLFSKTITSNTCQEVLALYNYGKGYFELKNNSFEEATTYLIKAKEIAEKFKDTLLEAKSISRLALSFNKLRQPDKSVEYDREGIRLLYNYRDKIQLLQFYSNINGHFGVWYDITEDVKYLDSIKKYIPISISLARILKSNSRISQAFSVLAGVSYLEKNYIKSLELCDSSLSYLDLNKFFKPAASVYQKICDNYIELKKYELALKYANLYLEDRKSVV